MGENDNYPDEWFDEFWSAIEPDEDDGISAVRIIGELLASECVWRDGDNIVGLQGAKSYLSADDQLLVRRIEEAVEHARKATDDESSEVGAA